MEVTRAEFVEAEAAARPDQGARRDVPHGMRRRIDHLVMVGGSSKIPAMQSMIAGLVGAEPDARIDPMTAIAEGAAVADAILQGIITDLQFFVGTEHALGTVVHKPGDPPEGRFSVLIGRNTKYPAKATDSYVPAVDFAEELKIQVIEGDPDKPIGHEDNVVLKSWPVGFRKAAQEGFRLRHDLPVRRGRHPARHRAGRAVRAGLHERGAEFRGSRGP